MDIGIKFCGGCNPRYNRREYLEKIKSDHKDDSFYIADETEKYDWLLVIGGCPSCCASYEQYNYDNLLKIFEPEDEVLVFGGNQNGK